MDPIPKFAVSEVHQAVRVSHRGGRDTLNECHRDMALWPEYDDSALQPAAQKRFTRLRDAMSLYLAGGALKDVVKIAKVGERQFLRIFARCLQPDASGRILGCRAFAKGSMARPPQRTEALIPSADGKAGFGGMFRKILRDYPALEIGLMNLLNAYGTKGLQPNRMTFRAFHRGFLKLCTAQGIGADAYPFNTKERARRALRRWIETDYMPRYAARFIAMQHGSDAGGLAAYGEGDGQADRPAAGYGGWVIDEYTIDLHAIYEIPNDQGDWEELELRRFQQIRITHLATGANLANRQVYAAQASSYDISMLFWDAVNGPPPVEQVVPDLGVEEGAGYPSCVIPELRFAIPSVIYLDNALAHLADHVQHMATHLFGATVILGNPGTPHERAAAESKFSLQARRVVHQLPSTTGSGPKDPLKKSSAVPPGKRVKAEALEEVLDVYVRNENALPAAGSQNIPPLTRLRRKLESGAIKPSYLPVDKRKAYYFCRPFTVTVKVDAAGGRRPYVNYLYQRYSSGALSKRFDLKGGKMLLRPDPRNLRTVMLFFEDGSEFGPVQALGRWGTFPHDARIRRLFGKFKREGELDTRADDRPLEALFAYLRKAAPRNPTAALQLTYLIRYLTRQDFEMGPGMLYEAQAWEGMSMMADRLGTLPMHPDPGDIVDVEPRSITTFPPALAAPPLTVPSPALAPVPDETLPINRPLPPTGPVVWSLPRRSMRR